jgi:hypothetical protein
VASICSCIFVIGLVYVGGQTIYRRILFTLIKDKKIKRRLEELERLRREGKISEETYEEIKKEIEQES